MMTILSPFVNYFIIIIIAIAIAIAMYIVSYMQDVYGKACVATV